MSRRQRNRKEAKKKLGYLWDLMTHEKQKEVLDKMEQGYIAGREHARMEIHRGRNRDN